MQLVVLGAVSRAHGLRGEVRVHLFNPESTALLDAERIWLQGGDGPPEPRRVEMLRRAPGDGQAVLMRLEGTTDRSAAEALRGCEVALPREALPPPDEDEHYVVDLIGLEVVVAGGATDDPDGPAGGAADDPGGAADAAGGIADDPGGVADDPGGVVDDSGSRQGDAHAAGAVLGEVVDVLSYPSIDCLLVRSADGDREVPMVEPWLVDVDLESGRVTVAQVEDIPVQPPPRRKRKRKPGGGSPDRTGSPERAQSPDAATSGEGGPGDEGPAGSGR
jgi:ribosomal 30S subunit maturation factor RimM